jgi:MoaA/NifB/PqqE/SkfB family radical SAM enzyme
MVNWISQTRPLDLLRRGISRRPWYVVLYVTSHCNQRCNMCFNWKNLNTLKRSEEVTLDEINRLARHLPDLYQLTLTGGEPTLRTDLSEIVEIFHRVTGVRRVTIATNGYYPDRVDALIRKITSTCPDLVLSVNLSLDGIGKDHDDIRGLEGSFDRLLETWALARRHQANNTNVNVATASVLTVSSLPKMKELLAWVVQNMDITCHGVMLARGDVATKEGAEVSDDAFLEILRFHRDLSQSKSRLNNVLADEYAASRVETIRSQKMSSPCRAGEKLLIIDERTNMHPCEILNVLAKNGQADAPELGDFCFGNLREVGFNVDILLNSQRGKDIRQFIRDQRCWCTFECAQINNLVLDPISYLRLFGRLVGVRQPT